MSQTAAVDFMGLGGMMPISEYVVHNATDEPVVMMWAAETRIIPPFNAIVLPNKHYPDVSHSLQHDDGEYVKGTLVIADVLGAREYAEGQSAVQWSAVQCIQHCLGIDARTGKAFGNLALKGVSFIPRNASKEQIARIVTEGRRRYVSWMEENCVAIVAAHDEMNRTRHRNGLAPNPPDKFVRRAQVILEATRKRDNAQVDATLGEMEKIISDQMPVERDEEAALLQIAKEMATQVRSDQDLMGDSDLLVARLLKDPEAMKLMRTKFKMRKLREPRAGGPEQGVQIETQGEGAEPDDESDPTGELA